MTQKRKIEDYVKTIYMLQKDGEARGAYIAKKLNVSRPTVSVSLKVLEQEGYLYMQINHTVKLTEKGLKIAKEVIKRNNALYHLLVNLGVDSITAEKDACNMEHVISKKSYLALLSLCKSSSGTKKT